LWKTYLAAEPGSPTAAKVLFAITNLNQLVNPPPRDCAVMDDEDLNERVRQLGRRVMAKAAAEAAVGQ
jgi:hypothetical protein